MKVVAIAAVGKNGVIGKGNSLPWNIPEDMKFFRDSTRDQIVVMGRKTYQALGKALPKRENAVITRDLNFKLNDARVFHALPDVLSYYRTYRELSEKTVFIIGGAEIYSLALPFLDEIWLTEIDADFEGDVFFPHYKNGKFESTAFKKELMHTQQDFVSSPYHYSFNRYVTLG